MSKIITRKGRMESWLPDEVSHRKGEICTILEFLFSSNKNLHSIYALYTHKYMHIFDF